MALRKDQKLLIAAAFTVLAVYAVPLLRPLILPLIYFNTHVHELAHALAALVTGGMPQHIIVNADGSGSTPILGGNILLVASAGYMGSTIFGGLLILGSRNEKSARSTLLATFVLFATSLLLLVRINPVGIISGLFWAAALGASAKFLKQDALIFLTRFLGLSLCLTSFQSFLTLVQLTATTNSHNDAMLLQQATMIPAILWSLSWMALSAVALFFTLKSAWNPTPKKTKPPIP